MILSRLPPMLRAFVLAVCVAAIGGSAEARRILFVGNSFTFGAYSAVRFYHPELVTDLNGEGIGGVPALFSTFADESRLDWQVSLETVPGSGLPLHDETKRDRLAGSWDVVVMQGFSALNKERPGDPTDHVRAAGRLAAFFKMANPAVQVDLVTSWSRADLTYRPGGIGLASRSRP